MRTFWIICSIGLFSILSYAQQFQLETTVDRNIEDIFDIDGDGVCEYIVDTNKVYDGLTHNLKYTFPLGSLVMDDVQQAQNPYSVFPNVDFNSDGKRDVILTTYGPDHTIIVFDVHNNIALFEFNPPEPNVSFNNLVDIDGDSELELVINTSFGDWPNTIYKTYIYSTGLTTSVSEENDKHLQKEFKLAQNYPNPFNPSTSIRYSLSGPENISVKIYDVSGQLVNEIFKEHNQAGEFEVIWDGMSEIGNKVSSGVYFYQLSVGNYYEAKKMILLK